MGFWATVPPPLGKSLHNPSTNPNPNQGGGSNFPWGQLYRHRKKGIFT